MVANGRPVPSPLGLLFQWEHPKILKVWWCCIRSPGHWTPPSSLFLLAGPGIPFGLINASSPGITCVEFFRVKWEFPFTWILAVCKPDLCCLYIPTPTPKNQIRFFCLLILFLSGSLVFGEPCGATDEIQGSCLCSSPLSISLAL